MSDIVAKHRSPSRTLYLDGTFKFSSGAASPVIDPATEDVIGDVADATPAENQSAIQSGRSAQKK